MNRFRHVRLPVVCPHCGREHEPPKTDRKAYMAALMRKRRQTQKGEKK